MKFSQQKFSERFEREAKSISSLNHPNICTLYDVGPNYLVMELIEGEALDALVKRDRCLWRPRSFTRAKLRQRSFAPLPSSL